MRPEAVSGSSNKRMGLLQAGVSCARISSDPFSDLMYDCQNLAFLLGVSFMPIIAR